jgi:DNA helicase HerA-like ATPase
MLTWDGLSELDAYQVTEIPRRLAPDQLVDAGRIQRVAALVAAYHAGAESKNDQAGALAIGWLRHSAGGPVQLLAAGAALAGRDADSEVFLTLPGGARATPLPRGSVTGLMARLPCWRAIGAISDGLLAGDERLAGDRSSPSMEDCLLAVWPGPFGMLLVAEPLGAQGIGEVADEIAHREQQSPDRRLQLRHAELRKGTSTGLWRVRLLAGGADRGSASRVAGLVCASADLTGLPYAIAPANGASRGLRDLLDDQAQAPAGGDAVLGYPFHASTELVAALCRPPEREVPGVRLTLRPDFDVTQELAAGSEALAVGEIMDSSHRPAGPLMLPLDSLNRHVFVSGATGSGKSQTVRALLEAATGSGIPWLVVEPAKAEYRLMAARLATAGPGGAAVEVVRIRPGESDAIAAGINPLEPAPDEEGRRFPLQAHADLVKALFSASFALREPLPQILSAALTRVYEDSGWDLALGETIVPTANPGYPNLADLRRAAIRIVQEVGYSQRVTDDVLGFIGGRLASLRLGAAGRFLEGGHQLDFGQLLKTNAVLEIEDISDEGDQAFVMGSVLIRLTEHLRMANRATPGVHAGLRHLTVIEEAHRLLRRRLGEASGDGGAVELFAGLLAEIRAYGEGVIVAEQIPDRLVQDVIKNTAVKITHRLPVAGDRDAVGATMNMTAAQNQFLVTLKPGQAAVFADGMDHPLLARMPDGTGREAAVQAAVATPAAVVRSRSITCGTDCAGRPCTLRDMRVAQRALGEYPAITLWAELSVLAHLTGWPMPVPRTALASLLQMMPSRLRDCAISHGVDAALAARVPVIAGRVSPVGLAAHVSTAIRSRLSRGNWLCQREEPKWLAPAYQWTLVLDALKSADRKSPGAGPHPRSSEWERTYGQVIAGDTCARQVGTVQRWYDGAQRDGWEVRAVAFGVDSPSGVERAVGAAAEEDDFEERLTGYLDQFVDCRWPRLYLTADPLGDPPDQR